MSVFQFTGILLYKWGFIDGYLLLEAKSDIFTRGFKVYQEIRKYSYVFIKEYYKYTNK
jgi:hypothetical protein